MKLVSDMDLILLCLFALSFVRYVQAHFVYSWQSDKLAWGIGIRGLIRGMATLPQGNQELLVVRDKVGRPPGELGVSMSMECDIFPSVL